MLITLGLSVGAMADGPKPSPTHHVMRYRVTHSTYGEIGSYTNVVDRVGSQTIVLTEVHLLVRLLGIVLHREDAAREERWAGDRLTYFHGLTTTNGEAEEIKGEAKENEFVVTTPHGIEIAPARVRPSNPWSAGFLKSDVMMRVDTGTIEQVQVGAAMSAMVRRGGLDVPTREYRILADPIYKVWLDISDIPVKFTVDDESGLVTFTLMD